ncbi:DUF2066 domain-containing protein [Microbaculum marinum]|uniref:DUF2066 domain-containing protein n=1 Tax=Microbaculum marinum TaxID=1764581 RepID=A0AAW9RZA0_9HYPH
MNDPARVLSCLALALTFVSCAPAAAADLYAAQTLVTGQGPESRAAGFAQCLREVLVKVSGNPRLADEPAVAALAEGAGDLVAGFTYRDRMAGIPVHDEQGSRDRPHVLTVAFDPGRVDRALRDLGSEPWPEPRPVLDMRVDVRNGTSGFSLTADADRGRDMRGALEAAAERYGMDVRLPESNGAGPAALPLTGTLVWQPDTLGWAARWHLDDGGRGHDWAIRDVSFDAAFRSAIGGAAQILSGNGAPVQTAR